MTCVRLMSAIGFVAIVGFTRVGIDFLIPPEIDEITEEGISNSAVPDGIVDNSHAETFESLPVVQVPNVSLADFLREEDIDQSAELLTAAPDVDNHAVDAKEDQTTASLVALQEDTRGNLSETDETTEPLLPAQGPEESKAESPEEDTTNQNGGNSTGLRGVPNKNNQPQQSTGIVQQADTESNDNLKTYDPNDLDYGPGVAIVMMDNRWGDTNSYLHLASIINKAYAQSRGHRFLQLDIDDPRVGCKYGTRKKDYCVEACSALFQQYVLHNGINDTRMALFIDSDAVISDFSMSFNQFVNMHVGGQKIKDAKPNKNPLKVIGAMYNRLTAETPWDVIVPTDCEWFQINAGIMLWKNSPSARDLVDEWVQRIYTNRKYKHFPAEQQCLKDWYNEPNSTIKNRLYGIKRGEDTWHIGRCTKCRSPFVPAKMVSHITGCWPNRRGITMVRAMQSICGEHLPKYNQNKDDPSIPNHCLEMLEFLADKKKVWKWSQTH